MFRSIVFWKTLAIYLSLPIVRLYEFFRYGWKHDRPKNAKLFRADSARIQHLNTLLKPEDINTNYDLILDIDTKICKILTQDNSGKLPISDKKIVNEYQVINLLKKTGEQKQIRRLFMTDTEYNTLPSDIRLKIDKMVSTLVDMSTLVWSFK